MVGSELCRILLMSDGWLFWTVQGPYSESIFPNRMSARPELDEQEKKKEMDIVKTTNIYLNILELK